MHHCISFYFISNIDCEAIRAQIALKLERLLSFMIRNPFLFLKKNQHMWEKNPNRGWASLTILQYSFKKRNSENEACLKEYMSYFLAP